MDDTPEKLPERPEDLELLLDILEGQKLDFDGMIAMSGIRERIYQMRREESHAEDEEVVGLRQQNERSHQQNEQLTSELAESQAEIRRLREENQRLKDENAKLREDNVRLEALSFTDELTGLRNRRAFDADLRKWAATTTVDTFIEERRIGGEQTTNRVLMLMDLDNFKLINDVIGYSEGGDYVLKQVSLLLQASARNIDEVYRLGGDEFAIICKVKPGIEFEVAACTMIVKRFYANLEALKAKATEARTRGGTDELNTDQAESLETIETTFAPAFLRAGCSLDDIAAAWADAMQRIKATKYAKGSGMR